MSLIREICVPKSGGDKPRRSPTTSGEHGFANTCPCLPSGRSGELDLKLMFKLETWYWYSRTTCPVADGVLAELSRHSQEMMASFAPLKSRRNKEHSSGQLSSFASLRRPNVVYRWKSYTGVAMLPTALKSADFTKIGLSSPQTSCPLSATFLQAAFFVPQFQSRKHLRLSFRHEPPSYLAHFF